MTERATPGSPSKYDLDGIMIFWHDESVVIDVPLTEAGGRGAPKRRIVVRHAAIAAALRVPPEGLDPGTAENWVRINLQRVLDAEERKRSGAEPRLGYDQLVILDEI